MDEANFKSENSVPICKSVNSEAHSNSKFGIKPFTLITIKNHNQLQADTNQYFTLNKPIWIQLLCCPSGMNGRLFDKCAGSLYPAPCWC